MKRITIAFTAVGRAELIESELLPPADHEVLVENEISGISAGTERANLLDHPNLVDAPPGRFPKRLGYSGVGRVMEVGAAVRSMRPGDRVLTYKGSTHSSHHCLPAEEVLKVEDEGLRSEHAVFGVIGSFSLNGIRRTRLEIGESAAVIGLGILGLFSVALCRIAGASSVIGCDLSPARREAALALGAHQVFDPGAADYTERVKAATRGGANVVIEVSGQSIALKQALGFIAPFGRISLLGCTRVSDTAIDFYQQVHRPGVEIIGAHARARPQLESRPHAWTWQDDVRALWRFMADGRLDMARIFTVSYSPEEAPTVYRELAEQPQDFPVGAVFDWRRSV